MCNKMLQAVVNLDREFLKGRKGTMLTDAYDNWDGSHLRSQPARTGNAQADDRTVCDGMRVPETPKPYDWGDKEFSKKMDDAVAADDA